MQKEKNSFLAILNVFVLVCKTIFYDFLWSTVIVTVAKIIYALVVVILTLFQHIILYVSMLGVLVFLFAALYFSYVAVFEGGNFPVPALCFVGMVSMQYVNSKFEVT